MKKNTLAVLKRTAIQTNFLVSIIFLAFMINSVTAFAVESSNISPDLKISSTYTKPSRILLDKPFSFKTTEPGGSIIKEGISILPASFFIRDGNAFLIDQAKGRVAIYSARGGFVGARSYLVGSYDSFTPSEIYVSSSSDRVMLADHLVTLKIREFNASGDLVNETLIDPTFALYPLGIIKVSMGEDFVDIQTSDGAIHPVVTNGENVFFMGQSALYLKMFRPLIPETGSGFNYKKTGASSAKVTVYTKGVEREINISIPEILNTILDVERVGSGVYAATMLLGREATPPNYDNGIDMIAVIYFSDDGDLLGFKQLPYVNQMDSSFRTIRNIGSNTYQMLITDERVVIALYQ